MILGLRDGERRVHYRHIDQFAFLGRGEIGRLHAFEYLGATADDELLNLSDSPESASPDAERVYWVENDTTVVTASSDGAALYTDRMDLIQNLESMEQTVDPRLSRREQIQRDALASVGLPADIGQQVTQRTER